MKQFTILIGMVSMLLVVSAPTALAQTGPVNPDFELVAESGAPEGWFVPGVVAQAGGGVEITDQGAHHGERCAVVTGGDLSQQGRWGNLMQSFDATPYQGKRFRLTAAVRVEGNFGRRAQLWFRVDRPNQVMGFFDNMGDRPITSGEWADYEITGEIDDDALSINIGLMVFGATTGFLDHVRFEILGDAGEGNQAPRALTEQGLVNLVAYARLFGYIRHFHPSDEASKVDWDAFAITGADYAESAENAEQLVIILRDLFAPIAPSVTIDVLPIRAPDPTLEAWLGSIEIIKPKKITAWWHFGFGQHNLDGSQRNIYRSQRKTEPAADAAEPDEIPPMGTAVVEDLGGGVWCRVPITLYMNELGTQPKTNFEPLDLAVDRPEGWMPTGDDRATRLGGIVLAWNVFQHFYPYFDVVGTDWQQVLNESLQSAATDVDEVAYLDTLRRLVAQLHDGHGRVGGPGSMRNFILPVTWDWVEDQLVVTRSILPQPAAGDVVLKINGRDPAELIAQAEQLISGATAGWKRYRALMEIGSFAAPGRDVLDLLRPDGTQLSSIVERVPAGSRLTDTRPEKIEEVRPGVWYVDLDRIDDDDFNNALPQLAEAKGIVFDLRGYPKGLSTVVISHLIDETVTCAQWHIPVVTLPDGKDMKFKFSNWPVQPLQPRLTERVAFITGGGAISYAETYLGIIEHYGLAEIVGSRTAGTNGNVNPFTIPGGYNFAWTGMKVLKHDGSQHHGIGIEPTVPVKRTIAGVAAGKDEYLEKAIEVVSPPG